MDKTAGKIRQAVGRLIDSGAHVSAASSTQFVAKKLGLSDRWISYTHAEIRNKLNEPKYLLTPYSDRILFLPHCLRDAKNCKAKYNEEGLQCTECGKCKLDQIIKMAKERGYRAHFVCPGGSMVKKLIEKHKPKAILGVCCFEEAQMAFNNLKGKGIGVQAVLLSKTGCVDTDVNLVEVREKMDLIDKPLKERKKRKQKKR